MTYKAICEQLKRERMVKDAIDAERAKVEYGDSFDSTFSYRKGDKFFVMHKESAIARHFRSLQNLE